MGNSILTQFNVGVQRLSGIETLFDPTTTRVTIPYLRLVVSRQIVPMGPIEAHH